MKKKFKPHNAPSVVMVVFFHKSLTPCKKAVYNDPFDGLTIGANL